jgi:hypothetical protein
LDAVTDCSTVELRQYTLHPGRRDTLIDLFEREFIEPQEVLGAALPGHFRALEEPNRFVWFRAFSGMDARRDMLRTFYTGPVWRAHRDVANATMVDSDNVLLLRPARPGSGFVLDGLERPAYGATPAPARQFRLSVYSLERALEEAELAQIDAHLTPERASGSLLGTFVTEETPNDFPALPVRENERVFVALEALRATYSGALAEALAQHAAARPEIWTLTPGARSLIR